MDDNIDLNDDAGVLTVGVMLLADVEYFGVAFLSRVVLSEVWRVVGIGVPTDAEIRRLNMSNVKLALIMLLVKKR